MRYTTYLIVSLVMQLVTWVITPMLPLFVVRREGWCNNHEYRSVAPRLPLWLRWFDTPDNSLLGDTSHFNKYILYPMYFRYLFWLYRNSLYGFKWTVLAGPHPAGLLISGDRIALVYHSKKYGIMHLKAGTCWQWKCVKPLWKWVLVFNFGWLLEDTSQERALFIFSPRIKKLHD